MPGYNQTGPMGQGPMTGRRMGRCTNYGANIKNANSEDTTENNEMPPEPLWGRGRGMGAGRGFGRGRGMGRGMGRGLGRQNRFRGGM
ncbi:MAG TPA: DUF5320 domain-containing protein [Tenuifilaceae bacterium]|nr:DUF5320 domain-containing protein [Tenuifilaceae bacterium]